MKVKVKMKLLSRVRLFGTPWTVAYQAPPPMGFSRQEHWSGLPLPFPEAESNNDEAQSLAYKKVIVKVKSLSHV